MVNVTQLNQFQSTVSGLINSVDSLRRLTIDVVRSWEHKGKTPNGREWYYIKELDVCCYITRSTGLKVYYNRKNNHSNAANSFYRCLVLFEQ